MNSKSTRTCYFDILNVVACFAVVMLHCSDPVFLNTGDDFWFRCVVVQSVFIFAVPIFFMISGANLLGYRKRYDTITFFKKRAGRILFVFIGCSILFYLVNCFSPVTVGVRPESCSPIDFVKRFMSNEINSIYWYFYAIIGLYLATPVFSKIADDKRLMLYAIVICFVMSMGFPFINRFASVYPIFENFTYPYLSSWLLYFLLGYYLAHHFDRHIPLPALAIAFIACVSCATILTQNVNLASQIPVGGPYDSYFSHVWCPIELVAICSLFLMAKQLDSIIAKKPTVVSIANKLSVLSLGIYAIHMFVLRVLGTHTVDSILMLGQSLTIRPIVIYALSALVVWLFRFAVKHIKSALKRS